MTSLVKPPACGCQTPAPSRAEQPAPAVAQCCAKISRTVAGCHD